MANTKYVCSNPKCRKTVEHDPSIRFIPIGWSNIRVLGTVGTYCGGCAMHFVYTTPGGNNTLGNISPKMQEDLGIGDD